MNIFGIFLLSVTLWFVPAPREAHMGEQKIDEKYASSVRYVHSGKLGPEAYELKIGKKGIVIKSSSAAGRFYAEKTLGQLVRGDQLYLGKIKDSPRFTWRGFMLDEARHFFGVEKVKELLDMMADYKLNRFHWHLSDNQGWRIEIKAFPELTRIGAIGCDTDKNAPARFYTQDEIREIVRYAAERHIEVIPEIDMPGHARALVRSIPQIDGFNGTVNPGSEKTYEVIRTILTELSGLFPGRYLHIGGDEVQNKKWMDLPEVGALVKKEGYTSIQEVQNYFGRRVGAIVTSLGKEVLAWDDLAGSGIASDSAVLQWWHSEQTELLKEAQEAGFRMVVCPTRPMYLDYCQEPGQKYGHKGRVQYFNTLRQLYEYTIEESPLVLGVQANLWTEHVHNSDRVDFMVYPRIFALAEQAWSVNRDFDDFLRRMEYVYSWMDSKGFYYYDARNPDRHPEPSCPNIK